MPGWKALQRWNVRSQWHLGETRELDHPPTQVEDFVSEALRKVTGQPSSLGPGVEHEWTANLRRPLSLYDQCQVHVQVEPLAETMRSKVTMTVSFDASDARIDSFVMAASSIVGLPAAFGWRAQSSRSAKSQAKKMFAEFWRALEPRLESSSAYR